jgi:hypothetical protein
MYCVFFSESQYILFTEKKKKHHNRVCQNSFSHFIPIPHVRVFLRSSIFPIPFHFPFCLYGLNTKYLTIYIHLCFAHSFLNRIAFLLHFLFILLQYKVFKPYKHTTCVFFSESRCFPVSFLFIWLNTKYSNPINLRLAYSFLNRIAFLFHFCLSGLTQSIQAL